MIKFEIQNLGEVPEALILVKEEVEKVKKTINEEGAKAQREDKRKIAREALDYADGLDNFIGKIDELKAEWEKLEKSIASATPEAREIVRAAGGTRVVIDPPSPKTGLRVKFPDGTVIHDSVAAVTFGKAIKRLGAGRAAAAGFKVNGEPLVSKNKGDFKKYPSDVIAIGGGWFANTHSSTSRKTTQLQKLSDFLGAGLTVEQVDGVFVGKGMASHSAKGTGPKIVSTAFPFKVGEVVQAVFPILQTDPRMTEGAVSEFCKPESSAKFSTGGWPVFKRRTGKVDETKDTHGHQRYYTGIPLNFFGKDYWLTSQFAPKGIKPVLAWLASIGFSQKEVVGICQKRWGNSNPNQGELPL